jgi:hypothetical protein
VNKDQKKIGRICGLILILSPKGIYPVIGKCLKDRVLQLRLVRGDAPQYIVVLPKHHYFTKTPTPNTARTYTRKILIQNAKSGFCCSRVKSGHNRPWDLHMLATSSQKWKLLLIYFWFHQRPALLRVHNSAHKSQVLLRQNVQNGTLQTKKLFQRRPRES